MAISAAIYIMILGSLSLLSVLLQGGAAVGQEPIQIYYGTNDEPQLRKITDETPINVTDTNSLLRLKFVANTSVILHMTNNISNLNESFYDKITHQTSNESIVETYLLKVRQSISIIVYGVLVTTHNTDYNVTLHFEVLTEGPTEISTAEEDTTTPTTQGGETTTSTTSTIATAPTAAPAASIQIETRTFYPLVVLVVVLLVVFGIATIVAIAMAIHYRNRLKTESANPA